MWKRIHFMDELPITKISPCELSKKGGWRHSIVDRGGLEVEHLKNGAPSSKEWMGQTNIS